MSGERDINAVIVRLRRGVQRVCTSALAPLVNWLNTRGVTPDQVTWVGFDLAVLAAFFAAFRLFVIAGILLVLSGVADLVDGALARRAGRVSAGGAFLDSMLDRGGEALLHVGAAVAFAWWGLWPGVLAVALSLAGSHLTSYARARAEALGIELEAVWVGRGERIVVLSAGLIFHFALIAFWIVAIASWAAAIHRAWLARTRLVSASISAQTVTVVSEDTPEDDPDDRAGA